MMLKVGSDYLDFSGTVELEQKVKLFENLDSSDGDVSFQFEVDETSKNVRLLNYPIADHLTKSVYQRIDCDLQDDSGVSLRTGFLRIERRVKRDRISLAFFSGNSNWFGLISGNLQDMDMSQYNIEQTEANVISSWSNTEGLTFPLVDNGGLLTRSKAQLKIEDLVGAFYVKTVFKQIFQNSQIKLTGELFEEPLYNSLITLKNSKDQEAINSRIVFVQKTVTQIYSSGLVDQVTWDNDSVYPYSNPNGYFDLTTESYTADVEEILKVELTLNVDSYSFFYVHYNYLRVNGVIVQTKGFQPPAGATEAVCSITFKVHVSAGDVIDIAVLSGFPFHMTSGTLKITPTFIYKTFGTAALPNWSKQDYVSSIFQIFNVITAYEPKTKTLTCNLFDKIKEKEPIDISRYLQVQDTDYTEFISSFGKKSTLSYNQVDFDEIKGYNIANFFKYGQGVINVNNDFLSETESIIESKFSNPFSYINGVFDMSMERTNLIELDEGDSVDVTSVTDNAGIARVNISEDLYSVGDLIRITDSTNTLYNGEFIINAQAAGYIELEGLFFDTNATATATKLDFTYANSDDVYLLVNIPLYNNVNFTGNESIIFEGSPKTSIALAYFSLLNTSRQINTDYKQSLSFGDIQDPLFYQRTILETYWGLVERVLNDPVKLKNIGVMPTNVYRSIDFLRPLMIKSLEASNLFYCNRISGYKSSYEEFLIDLIKLP